MRNDGEHLQENCTASTSWRLDKSDKSNRKKQKTNDEESKQNGNEISFARHHMRSAFKQVKQRYKPRYDPLGEAWKCYPGPKSNDVVPAASYHGALCQFQNAYASLHSKLYPTDSTYERSLNLYKIGCESVVEAQNDRVQNDLKHFHAERVVSAAEHPTRFNTVKSIDSSNIGNHPLLLRNRREFTCPTLTTTSQFRYPSHVQTSLPLSPVNPVNILWNPYDYAHSHGHRNPMIAVPPSSLVMMGQNCCAKCGAQFRLTSDLVYHMRTHHKREVMRVDENESKKLNKFKCPVCQETFREKHHLSRHMTSHND